MPISPAAIAALCDDLRQWRDRIQSAIGNDLLNWQSFGGEVFDDADRLLARLRMVENAGPLADAIDTEMSDSWHFVTMNIGGNAWKGTSEGKSVISDLELCHEFGENVKRRVANALAAVEQHLPKVNPISLSPTTGAASDDIVKRLETLERQPKEQPKRLTKSEKVRKQRNDFSCKRRTKNSPETWNEIYHAYNKKFPNDKDASPATLRLSHGRNCQKCQTK